MQQLEIFPSDIETTTLFDKIDALPLVAQKTYVYIVRFVYWGVKNVISSGKNEKKQEERYVLKSKTGKDAFQWSEETLDLLNSRGLITCIGGNIRIQQPDNLDDMGRILKKYSKTHSSLFQCNVSDQPSALLEELSEGIYVGSTASPRRSTQILRPHDAESTDSWAFCVPRCFNDALDIKLSENKYNTVSYAIWTQGQNFAFKSGDMIHGNLQTGESWGQYVNEMAFSLHVESSVSASPPEKEPKELDDEKDIKRKIVSINPGYVKFKIMVPNPEKTGAVYAETRELTQVEFVKMLIAGIESPPCLKAG
jgi:hypothetical protein